MDKSKIIFLYLINIAFPASDLTGSTSFQDSFKVILVLRLKGTERFFNPKETDIGDRFLVVPRWWNEAEHPITNTSEVQVLEKPGSDFTL